MKLIEQLFKIIAPSSCQGCESEGSLLCPWCIEVLLDSELPRCYRCNALTSRDWVCARCRSKAAFRWLWIRTMYNDTARQLIHSMKFRYSLEAADLVAQELAGLLPALPPETVIVPAPTITSHIRQRGYDHTLRISRQLAKISSLRCHAVLARTNQHRQVGSSRTSRLHDVSNTIRVKNRYLVAGKPVLLVDDVLTTGTTITTAAAALKSAGALRVDVIVFARAK